MTQPPFRLPLLIAVSLLTAGLALAGTPGGLAAEEADAERSTHVREPHEPGPRNLTLEGVVVNASSNETVADVELRIHNAWRGDDGDTKARESFTVDTDDEGRYRLNVSQGLISIRVDDPRYQRVNAEFEIEDDLVLDLPLEPVSQDLARVHGTVTSDGGEPIEDAYVRVSAAPEECPDDEECERHHRTARADGGSGSAREVETSQGTVEITYHPRQDRYASTQTDADGGYEIRVPAGAYDVRVRAEDHLSDGARVEAPEGGAARADVTLTPIPPASVTVTGQVVDEETGEPVERAEVRLHNQRWGTHNGTMTDEDGRFQVAIQPGYTGVRISADESYYVPCEADAGDGGDGHARPAEPDECDARRERSQAYMPVSTVIQPDADEQVRLDEALVPEPDPDAHIDGWVVNASSGDGIAGASLRVVNEATNEWGHAETGEDGSFRIAVDEGYYTVRVHAEGYYANATNVRVDGDGTRATLQLTPGQAADGGCCYRTPVEESAAHDSASAGGDGEAEQATESPSRASGGDQVYAGGPGELGPHPDAEANGGPGGLQQAPGPGLLDALIGLLAALGLVAHGSRD